MGQAGAAPAPDSTKPEVEGLQAGLDWYGTNEDAAALFLTGQQQTTSDSEGGDYGDDFDGEGSEGEAGSGGGGGHARGGGAPGAGGHGEGGPADEAALPRHVRARLVEQEAYIAELEDQNLRWVLRAGLSCLVLIRAGRHACSSLFICSREGLHDCSQVCWLHVLHADPWNAAGQPS